MTDVKARTADDATWDALNGWRAASACRDLPSVVFLAEGPMRPLEELAAKAICARCVVIDACLSDAIAHDDLFGVWGGMTAAERRPLRRARRSNVTS